jgi:hypothetical protein
MDDNNQQTGQQGYGQDEDPTRAQGQQPNDQQRDAQPIGGNDLSTGSGTAMTSGSSTGEAGASATGQASYGNSGDTGASQSQNSSDLGQASDMGQSTSPEQSGFIGSGNPADDRGGSSSSANQQGTDAGQSGNPGSTPSGSIQQDGSTEQDFAFQGQGALDRDIMGDGQNSSESRGTDDIEVERSQGREPGIDGSSL